MAQSTDFQETVVHLIAYLDICLEADLTAGLAAWEHAFAQARNGWQLGQTQQLLQIVKKYPLNQEQRAWLRTLEAHILVQQGEWSQAVVAYEQSLNQLPQQVSALSGLGSALRRIEGRTQEAVAWFQQALDLADQRTRPGILNNLGLAYYESGQLDKAQAAFNEALATYQAGGDKLNEADVLHNLGSLAWTRGRLRAAEAHFSSALVIYQELSQRHALAETLNSLGLVQEADGRWQEAAATYLEALTLLQQDRDDYGQAQTLANLGNVLTLLQDYEGAIACFRSGLLLARDLEEPRLEGQLLNGLAELQQSQQQFAEAINTYEEALARKQAGNATRSLKHTWLSLASLYRQMHRPVESQSACEKALAMAREQRDLRVEAHALMELAHLAMAQGQRETLAALLDNAHCLVEAENYSEVKSEIARLRGDLEILQPEPDYHRLLIYYGEALAHAHDFNETWVRETLDYLGELLRAIADDGQPDVARQMAADLGTLLTQLELPEYVVAALHTFVHELTPLPSLTVNG